MDPDPENLPGLGSGWGALSEYAVVCDPEAPWPDGAPDCAFAQTVLDDDLDPVDATMIVTFREVLSNIRYFGITPNDSVVVFGCGPVGLTYLKFMSLLGVKNLVACDILPEKLAQAKDYGATYLINSKEQDVAAEVRKLFPEGVDYVLDAAGVPATVDTAPHTWSNFMRMSTSSAAKPSSSMPQCSTRFSSRRWEPISRKRIVSPLSFTSI